MKIALIGNIEKGDTISVAVRVAQLIRANGGDVMADPELASMMNGACVPSEELERCDAAIALGGDGTVLRAVHRVGFAGVPVLGINLGTLGFLAEVPVEEVEAAVKEIIAGDVIREERTYVITKIGEQGRSINALNEIVIDKRGGSRMIQIDVSVDGAFLNSYIADGLIVSTPTGSTAYALSAGGPIVSPNSRDFIITPLSPHALTARPLVVPDSVVINITAHSEHNMTLSGDGLDYPLSSRASIEIRRATSTITFLRRRGVSHYDVLRAKLLWGKDARGAASKLVFREDKS